MKIFKTNKTIGFIIWLIIYSAIPYFLIIQNGNTDTGWTFLLMLAPALAAFTMMLINKESFKNIGWRITRKAHWLLLAAFVPLLVEGLSIVISITLGFAQYNTEYISIKEGLMSLKGGALLFGTGPSSIPFFLMNYLLTMIAATLFYVPFALGEEIGWRGYLQKNLTSTFGIVKGLVLVGIIWGYWHLPGVLLGHNFPDYPVFGGLVLMPIITIGFSFVFGTFYRKANNIWIPALFHAANNICSPIPDMALLETGKNSLAVDIIWISIWAVIAITVYTSQKKQVEKLAFS